MTQLILYYSLGACSLAAHVALHEWGAPFDARRVTIAKAEHQTPEYLALNPRARVPTLVIDGKPVTELSGLLTWIGQQSGLYPKAGTLEAAKCGEWLGWMTSVVHIAFALIWRGERFADDEALHPALRQRGYDLVGGYFDEIDTTVGKSRYVLGDQFTVADCNILPFYRWGGRIGLDMNDYPNWKAHTLRLLERPSVQAALAEEGIDIHDTPPLPEGVRAPRRA